jgi:hypothetical protein
MRCNIPIDYHEATHIRGCRKKFVASRHDEPNNTLEKHSEGKAFARTDPVAHICTNSGAGKVKQVRQSGPAKGLPQGCILASDNPDPLRGVKTEGIRREIVDEPDQRDDGHAEPVEPGRSN